MLHNGGKIKRQRLFRYKNLETNKENMNNNYGWLIDFRKYFVIST